MIILPIRIILVVILAAAMAILGYACLCWAGAEKFSGGNATIFVIPSEIIWLAFAFVIKNRSLSTAIVLGILSPIIGGFFFMVVGVFVVFYYWYICFPIGIATGILMKAALGLGADGKIEWDGE